MNYAEILRIYEGSNGDATRALYAKLEEFGPAGVVAMNLFRAHKASSRAKVYRGGIRGQGSFKSMAYNRKQWSIDNLEIVLVDHATTLSINWGWGKDSATKNFEAVLYVELPTGQVSFHSPQRGKGPAFDGKWDGIRGVGPQRICNYCAQVLAGERR